MPRKSKNIHFYIIQLKTEHGWSFWDGLFHKKASANRKVREDRKEGYDNYYLRVHPESMTSAEIAEMGVPFQD